MTDLERKRLRVQHLSDQAWTDIARHEADLDRIVEHGPDGSEKDSLIMLKAVILVSAEIHGRAAERLHYELGGLVQD